MTRSSRSSVVSSSAWQLGERQLGEDAADGALGPQRLARDRADRARGTAPGRSATARGRRRSSSRNATTRAGAQLVALLLAERLERAARLEQAREPVVGRRPSGSAAAQAGHLDRRAAAPSCRHARGAPELEELVRLAARQRRLHHALEGVRGLADAHEERVRRGEHGRRPRARDEQVQPVEELPHLARDLLAHAARVLPRARHAGASRHPGWPGCQSMNSVTAWRV